MNIKIGEEIKLKSIGIIFVLTIVAICLLLNVFADDSTETTNSSNLSDLVWVQSISTGYGLSADVYYDKNTKVMYYAACYYGITPIYNADGTLKLYEDDKNA